VIQAIQQATIESRFSELWATVDSFIGIQCHAQGTATPLTEVANKIFIGQMFELRDCKADLDMGNDHDTARCLQAYNAMHTGDVADFFGVDPLPLSYEHGCTDLHEEEVRAFYATGALPAVFAEPGANEIDPWEDCGPAEYRDRTNTRRSHHSLDVVQSASELMKACFFYEPACGDTSDESVFQEECLEENELYVRARASG
jgi:hypothetical protein